MGDPVVKRSADDERPHRRWNSVRQAGFDAIRGSHRAIHQKNIARTNSIAQNKQREDQKDHGGIHSDNSFGESRAPTISLRGEV